MKTKEQLQSDKQLLQSEFYRIRDEIQVIETELRRAENEKLVGNCYKYRNSYGNGDPGWWLFLKIKSLSDCGELIVDSFQVCSYGKFEFTSEQLRFNTENYISITSAEYNKELKKFLAKLQKVALTKWVGQSNLITLWQHQKRSRQRVLKAPRRQRQMKRRKLPLVT